MLRTQKRILMSYMISFCSFRSHAVPIPLIAEAQKAESVKAIMDSGEVIKATINPQGRVIFPVLL